MSASKRRLHALAAHLEASSSHGEEDQQPLAQQLTQHACSASMQKSFPFAQDMSVFPEASHDVLDLDSLLSAKAKQIRDKTRAFMVKEVAPIIAAYWERAEFPHELVPKVSLLNLGGGTLVGNGCPGLSVTEFSMAIVEMARVDASFSTFLMVHNCLAMLTIGLLGSEAQKAQWLPRMASLDAVGCWALTEPSNGSDASALTARAEWTGSKWRITGQKRWIGNGTFAECVVVWARNTTSGQVNAFIVRKGTPGMKTVKIENKTALRCVQNADIYLDSAEVDESDRLPGVESFKDTNKVLAISRIMVAWQPVGIAAGVYDMCVRYTKERQQFSRSLASFQLQQERLARMAGSIQGMWLLGWRLSALHEEGKMTHEQASLVKAQITLRCREVAYFHPVTEKALNGRQWNVTDGCLQSRESYLVHQESEHEDLLFGVHVVVTIKGVVADFLVAKAFCDLEAIYTYEGTYDINSLVAGRGITGVSAFKAR